MTGHLGPGPLRRLIQSVDEGTTEIMLHPGICDSDLQKVETRLLQQRDAEMEALIDPGVKSAIEERGIRLITYAGLN